MKLCKTEDNDTYVVYTLCFENASQQLQSAPDQGLQQMSISGDLSTLSNRLANHGLAFAETVEHIEFTP